MCNILYQFEYFEVRTSIICDSLDDTKKDKPVFSTSRSLLNSGLWKEGCCGQYDLGRHKNLGPDFYGTRLRNSSASKLLEASSAELS